MAVKIKRERPDQRRHHRVTAPLHVGVGGHVLRATDWSLGGLRLVDYPDPLPEVDAEIQLELTLPFQGFDVTFQVKSAVVRNDPATRMFAVRYTEIGERERELMQHFIEELVRGSMVDVEDTIQRIDIPVTPASLEPDRPRTAPEARTASAPARIPVRRMPVKTMAMSSLYLVLGLIVFGYAGILAYTNFFRMEVQTAVITAPVETVTAQADGQINLSTVKPGDEVKSGQVIANLLDNELEREIEIADIAVQERKAKLAFLKQRHIEELDRIKGYATIDMKNVQQTKVELEALAAQLRISEDNLMRLGSLHAKGFTTDSKLQEAEKQVITIKKELEIRRIELASRVELAEDNIGKRMYSGNETIGSGDLIGKGSDLEAEVRYTEYEIQLAQQRYITFLSSRDREAVHSPFEGTILELPRFDKGTVRRGDVIAIIEQRRNRQVSAWLTQDEVLKVGLGDEALLYVPALGETLKGRVRQVDRTSGFVREQDQRQNPGYAWRGATDRSAKVTIEFSDQKSVADYERYRSGLPVVVVFEQRSTSSILSTIRKKLGIWL